MRGGGRLFRLRVAAVVWHRDRLLLHRPVGSPSWSLPGGAVRIGETAVEALRREFAEELDVTIEVGRLRWVVENFFDHWPLDGPPSTTSIAHHEVGLCFLASVPASLVERDTFRGTEDHRGLSSVELEFRWCSRAELPGTDIRPSVLADRLSSTAVDGPTEALVQRDA